MLEKVKEHYPSDDRIKEREVRERRRYDNRDVPGGPERCKTCKMVEYQPGGWRSIAVICGNYDCCNF